MYVLLKRLMRISLNVESRIQLANQQWKPSTETKRDYIEICFCSNDSPCHACSRHRRHKKMLNFSFCSSNFQAWLHMTRSKFWSQISPYKKVYRNIQFQFAEITANVTPMFTWRIHKKDKYKVKELDFYMHSHWSNRMWQNNTQSSWTVPSVLSQTADS